MHTDFSTLSLEHLHELKRKVGPTALAEVDRAIAAKTAPQPKLRRSSVPAHLQREGDVEQDVDAELERLGFDVTRLSQPRASKQTPGIPDRYARHVKRRIRLWIEVKQPGGEVSADQKRWHRTERESGGEVIVVWTLQDLHDELRSRGFDNALLQQVSS